MPTRSVELLPAFLFVCDECGRDNFSRMHRIEPESLEGTEIAEEIGRENAELAETFGLTVGGDYMVMPDEVVCEFCGTVFEVNDGDE
jgi:hypothetical protein